MCRCFGARWSTYQRLKRRVKALEALSIEAYVANDAACHASEYAWQEKEANLPKSRKTLLDDKEILHVSSKRDAVLKKVAFDAISGVPTKCRTHHKAT